MRKVIVLMMLVLSMMLVSGCKMASSREEIAEFTEDMENKNYDTNAPTSIKELKELMRDVAREYKETWCYRIIAVSMIVGTVLLLAVKKNKSIRQYALFVLIIGCPIFNIILLFVMGFFLETM